MEGALIFTTCTAGKDDSEPVGKQSVEPKDYISDARLLRQLLVTRAAILSKPEARAGARDTYAFDLYVRSGQAYEDIRKRRYYDSLKHALLHETIRARWFFLSGGYGVIAAFERARDYQATFRYRQKEIPRTHKCWQPSLTQICEHIVARHNGWKVYVFGSQDYTAHFEGMPQSREIRIFKSRRSVGNRRLSPVLADFAAGMLGADLATFDTAFPPGVMEWSDRQTRWVPVGATR
jgi:hypothetical protein